MYLNHRTSQYSGSERRILVVGIYYNNKMVIVLYINIKFSTLHLEQIPDGTEGFSSSDSVPENAAYLYYRILPQGGPMTRWRLPETTGCEE